MRAWTNGWATWAAAFVTCASLVACVANSSDEASGTPATTDGANLPPPTDNATPPAGTTSGATKGADVDAGKGKEGGASSGSSSGGSSSGGPFDQFQIHNRDVINQYRATKSLPPVALDLQISTFALAGSVELSHDHTPHQHFITASNDGSLWSAGFQNGAAENQGDPDGWYKMANDPVENELKQIDDIELAMFNEGPGAGHEHGHYMNMMNADYKRVGVGLYMVGDSLYLTNDFSE